MDELKVEECKKQVMENKKHGIESKIRKEFDGSNMKIFCLVSTSNNECTEVRNPRSNLHDTQLS